MSRNRLFKHLKSEGLVKPGVVPSQSKTSVGSHQALDFSSMPGRGPPRSSATCSDERAGGALNHQDARGTPSKAKPGVKWADIEDDSHESARNYVGKWNSGDVKAMNALKSQSREQAVEVVRAKHNSTVDVGEVYSPPGWCWRREQWDSEKVSHWT